MIAQMMMARILLHVGQSELNIAPNEIIEDNLNYMSEQQIATFGGGCFWCIESALNKVKGVQSAISGFAGGEMANPTYRQVVSGLTGHAEVVQVTFNPCEISFEDLLELFFQLHDPTTLNRQGNDIGSQYRSIILYHNPAQQEVACNKIKLLDIMGIWPSRIVTEVKQYDRFYPADEYHQGYADNFPEQPYCALLIAPKIEAFKSKYSDWLK